MPRPPTKPGTISVFWSLGKPGANGLPTYNGHVEIVFSSGAGEAFYWGGPDEAPFLTKEEALAWAQAEAKELIRRFSKPAKVN